MWRGTENDEDVLAGYIFDGFIDREGGRKRMCEYADTHLTEMDREGSRVEIQE